MNAKIRTMQCMHLEKMHITKLYFVFIQEQSKKRNNLRKKILIGDVESKLGKDAENILVPDMKLNHLDFVYATDADALVYNHTIDIIGKKIRNVVSDFDHQHFLT
ncbi:CLUMA_CG007723, isoform A [Clunio marinus]|uniref:CLUMA_CG007723, isoform A n=1 Tax=Clunio marinus TaxID=568069 RepID=A0A1J1I1K4_9DIPT|nr:CLUMA_CG007723, isoform A [Clunio marinus]